MDVHCAYCVVGEYFRCNESIWWKRFEWSFISLSFPKQNYIILWWDWVGFQELHLQFRGSIFRSGRESRNLSQQSHQSRNLSQQSHQSRNLSLQLSRSAGHPPNLSSSPSIPHTHTHKPSCPTARLPNCCGGHRGGTEKAFGLGLVQRNIRQRKDGDYLLQKRRCCKM